MCSVAQLCPTLCNPMYCSHPSSSVHGIFQAGILERVVYPAYYIAAVVQPLSHVWLFVTPWAAAHQASLSSTISQSLFKFISIELVMPSNYFILCHSFSFCLQYLLASGSFPMSQHFASGGQSIGASASASVFPMNIQGTHKLETLALNLPSAPYQLCEAGQFP